MAYTHTTRAQFRTLLANRMGDPNMVFWVSAELNRIIDLSLMMWSALTGFYRGRDQFTISAETTLYDLDTVSDLSDSLGYTRHDQDVFWDMEYFLMEPITTDWSNWEGSDMFTIASLVGALQQGIDTFRLASGVVLAHSSQYVGQTVGGAVSIAASVLDIHLAHWKSIDGRYYPLHCGDEREFQVGWNVEVGRPPDSYSVLSANPLSLQLKPIPTDIGYLDLITTSAHTTLDPTSGSTGVLVSLPDDFTPFAMWGAMGKLLEQEGPARDLGRAEYCRSMFDLGVELGKNFSRVLNVQVNGRYISPSNLISFSFLEESWMAVAKSQISDVPLLRNMLGIYPTPATANSTLTLDLVKKATLPTADGSYLQIPPSLVGPLLDYAQHLASFKMAGNEFQNTIPKLQSFLNEAAKENSRLNQLAKFRNLVRMTSDLRVSYSTPSMGASINVG